MITHAGSASHAVGRRFVSWPDLYTKDHYKNVQPASLHGTECVSVEV